MWPFFEMGMGVYWLPFVYLYERGPPTRLGLKKYIR